jgi:hypothetical protein
MSSPIPAPLMLYHTPSTRRFLLNRRRKGGILGKKTLSRMVGGLFHGVHQVVDGGDDGEGEDADNQPQKEHHDWL